MARLHSCIKCNKSFASSQSLWNHKQRCSNPKKSESDDKEKIIGDILNKVEQRVNDQAHVNKLELKMVDTGSKPKSDLPVEEKTNESDFNLESDSSEESDHDIPDNREKLKEKFRELYLKFHQDIGILDKLILTLDELEMMDCLTKEECDSMKEVLKNKIDFSKDDEYAVDDPEELKAAFRDLYNRFQHNIEMYNKLVLMLDEMEKMGCLTKEDCNAINRNLQNKIGL